MTAPANPFAAIDPEKLRQSAGIAQIAGVLMIIFGALAVLLPGAFSLGLELFLGWLFLIGGVLSAVTAFQHLSVKGQGWAALNGVLAAITGGLLIARPLLGVFTLTLLLTAFYVADGVCKLVAAARGEHLPARGLVVMNGVFGLIIAGIVISEWPLSAEWFLGLIIGVNLLLGGMTLLGLAAAAKKAGRADS